MGKVLKLPEELSLTCRNRQTKLALCRKLTRSPLYKPRFEGLEKKEILSILLGKDMTQCPGCKKGHLKSPFTGDTS
jgi:hypothetical protein